GKPFRYHYGESKTPDGGQIGAIQYPHCRGQGRVKTSRPSAPRSSLGDTMDGSARRFEAVLSRNVDATFGVPTLDEASAARLLERTANVPFFAHSYTFYHNMIHGFTPHDLARFAYEHD